MKYRPHYFRKAKIMRHEEEEDIYDDDLDLESLDQEEDKDEESKGKKKLKLFIPLVALIAVCALFGAYYYVMQLQNSISNSTPVTDIPEPIDTVITGGDNLDQVALAEAQLKKEQVDALNETKPASDEELTRIDFSIKSKGSNEEIKTIEKPVTNQPIVNDRVILKNRSSNYKVNNKTPVVKSQSTNVRPIQRSQVDEDPFNIVVAQKPTSQHGRINSNSQSTTTTENNDYNEYLKKFSASSEDEEPIPATIAGRQRIYAGQTVAIKLQKDMLLKGQTIKKGTVVYGLPTVDDGRIGIKIRNIKNGTSLIKTNISVLGEDMNEGVQYQIKGTTDYSQTKGQVVDLATSQLGTIGSIISGTSRSNTKFREPEYWLNDGKKVYLSIN